jgi:hypothetical protein
LAWVFGGILWGKGASLARNYVLYLVKAAHIGVITQLVLEGQLPPGTNQFAFGKDVVLKHFLRVSVLFAVDQLVRVVLRAFNRSIFKLLSFIPGSQSFRNFFQRVLDYSLGYVDEAILSYSLVQPEKNPWATAKDGLILYVQNWKTILGSGFVLALISYAVVGVITAPGLIMGWMIPGPLSKIAVGVFAGLGLLVKFALMDPFALTSVIVNYHHAIAGQTADLRWNQQLEEVSDKYREFSKRAKQWGLVDEGPPPAPVDV